MNPDRAAYRQSLSTDRFTAGQLDTIIAPAKNRGLPPVVYLHSVGGDAKEAAGYTIFPSVVFVLRALAREGYTIVAPSAPGSWGNATTVARIDAALTYARSTLGCSTKPAILIGASHGSSVLKYANDYPAKVSAVVCFNTIVDWNYVVLNDPGGGGLRSSINLAWARTAGDTSNLPAGISPATLTSGLAQVHQQLWYASDDPLNANIGTYASAVGCDLRNVGALGHTDAMMQAVSIPDVVTFVKNRT